MKKLILALIAFSSVQAQAKLEITKQDAQKIIDTIKWEKLGARTEIRLSQADAECMTLNNYDNKVGFDCIIKNSEKEVVLSRRDIEQGLHYMDENLLDTGLLLTQDRAQMRCFETGKCELIKTLSTSEEKHRYCFMTVHRAFGGKLVKEDNYKTTVKIKSVDCKAQWSEDFLGNPHTLTTSTVEIESGIETDLGIHTFHSSGSVSGHVSSSVACAAINDTLDNGKSEITATVETRHVQQESTSIRNSDKRLIEQIRLSFANNVFLSASERKQTEKGAFCADFKE